MYTIAAFVALCAVANALTPPHITGTTPPAIHCPNKLCHGKYDGNYELRSEPNYFLQCVSGLAYCQPCWPLHLVFSQRCNQCLYNKYDKCSTTEKWYPAVTYYCPDECPRKGPHFTGNINDRSNPKQYVACFKGATVGCIACPKGLEFNEEWNACLYEGKYKTTKYVDTYGHNNKGHSGHGSYKPAPQKPYGGHNNNHNGGYKPAPQKPYGGHNNNYNGGYKPATQKPYRGHNNNRYNGNNYQHGRKY